MAANKTTEKTTPKAPKSEAEIRKAWAEGANKALAALDRAARKVERLSAKSNVAREDQIKAFTQGATALSERILRAAKGESGAAAIVPLE